MGIMFFRNWGKFLFCVLLVCLIFLSISSSFAAGDSNVDLISLESDYDDSVDLSVSNDKVYSDSISNLKGSSNDDSVLGDDEMVDDEAFNEDDPWVENLEEDSHDEELEIISGFEGGIGPGAGTLDNRLSSKLVVSSFSKYYRNGTQLVGYLQDASNNPLVGKTVKINIANANYTRTTDENGGFRLNINLKPNNYTSTISFAGDSNYKPSSKTITVKVFTMPTSITSSNLIKYYRNASQLVAQLKDVHGNPLVGKNITITILGNVYQRATDEDGHIHMNINMHPRVCNATLNFTENGYVSSKKVVSITVLEMPTSIVSSNLEKHYRNGSYWVARLLDGNGNPLAGKTLTFNIDTHTYTRVSDDDGYCYMTINLRPGTFTGTASFSEQYYTSSSKTISVNVLYPPVPNVNVESGVYNSSSLFVDFSAYIDSATVYCSFDNGANWVNDIGSCSFNLCEGNWTILSYVSLNGYESPVATYNYKIGEFDSSIWHDYGSGIYESPFYVHFNDINPSHTQSIHYTLDGTEPTLGSDVYSSPIFISNQSNRTVLKYFIKDANGTCSNVVNVYYFFGDLVANLNNGKMFAGIQEAIDDNDTVDGDVIEVSCDTFGSVVLNKGIYLKACRFKPVHWYGIGDESIVNIICDNVVVDGFNFTGSNIFNVRFANNCSILNNFALIHDGYGISCFYCSFCKILRNCFLSNTTILAGNIFIRSSDCLISENDFTTYHKSDPYCFSSLESSNQVIFSGTNESVACLSSGSDLLVDEEVLLKIDGADFIVHTDSNGDVYLPIDLSEGLHTVVFYFKGDENYLSSYNVSKIFVIDDAGDISLSVSEASGFYDCSELLVNFSSSLEDAIVFCSFDNGTTWSQYDRNICYNLSEGIWDILAYCSLYGFNSSLCNCSFVVGNSSPLVWASNGSGIYNESFEANLSAFSSIDDDDVLIYYTLDGSMPTSDSLLYDGPLFISNQSTITALRFFARDNYNHTSDIVSVYYCFGECIVNLNNGKMFNSVQEAIDDDETVDGDVIEVSCDLNESVVLNKSVSLRSCDYRHVIWTGDSSSVILLSLDSVEEVFIEGFVFNSSCDVIIDLNGSSNCVIVDNVFCTDGCSITDFSLDELVSFNNSIWYNGFYGNGTSFILLENAMNYSFVGNLFNVIYESNQGLVDVEDCSFAYGINLDYCENSVFYANEFSDGDYGIFINESSSNYFAGNMFSNIFNAVKLSGFNNTLFNNSFMFDEYGIVLDGLNNSIISNTIVNNSFGVFSNGSLSNSTINFNRIVDNSIFGVYVADGSVNITNNWWGHNGVLLGEENGDLYFVDGLDVLYEPYLVLRVYVGEYKIADYFVENCSFVADLTHNSFGEDVSPLGCIPDCDVLFRRACNYYIWGDNLVNEIVSHDSNLISGEASSIFDLKLNNNLTVFLDNEEVSYFIEYPPQSVANISVSTTALLSGENFSPELHLTIPFYNPVDWFTVIWKSSGLFEDELYIIVDGNVLGSLVVENSVYSELKNYYSLNVFNAIKLYNKFLYNNLYKDKARIYSWISLLYNRDSLDLVEEAYYSNDWIEVDPSDLNALLRIHNATLSGVLLNLLKNHYNLSDDDVNFIAYYHEMFLDNVTVDVSYLGGTSSSFNLHSDDGLESFDWMGDRTSRSAVISYDDGTYAYTVGDDSPIYYDKWENTHCFNGTVEWNYHNSYGYYAEGNYDGFLTFTFANDKVTDDVLTYWLDEKNRTVNGSLYYGNGFMKAAFGSFIEGLDVIYCNDLCADIAAERFNVTWVRTSPMVMSVHDDIHGTVLSGESSFYFGRTAYGNSDDVRSFYFACSASFSPIEHYVTNALFPNQGNNGSATVGLGFILDSGGEIEIVQDGDLSLIREVGSNDKVLVFDSSTGLLRDQIFVDFCGAYCYSDQQTDWACDFAWNMRDAKNNIWNFVFNNSFMDWANNDVLGVAGSVGISVGIACLPVFPVGTVVGALMISGGVLANYYSNDLNKGGTRERWANFGVDIALSSIPVAGAEIKSGSVIGKVVLSKSSAKLSVAKVTSKKMSPLVKHLANTEGVIGSSLKVGTYEYGFSKFGTVESIVKTAYRGVDKYDVLDDFMQNYLIGVFADGISYNIFKNNS